MDALVSVLSLRSNKHLTRRNHLRIAHSSTVRTEDRVADRMALLAERLHVDAQLDET